MNKYILSFLIIFFITSQLFSQSIKYEEQDIFFTEMIKNLQNSYIECTGDTNIPEIKYLLEWKNRIHLQTETKEYKEILKEYIIITGILEDILPCHVLNWHKSRIRFLQDNEESAKKKLLEKNDKTVDSLRYAKELKLNPKSKFDFKNIPFGFSKKSFIKLFNKKLKTHFNDYDSLLEVEHFIIKETPYILKFFFNKENRYYKYEVESYAFSGNDLNSKIRPAADILKNNLETKIGPPHQLNRIGYFDIKPAKPSLYCKWITDNHEAFIYYAIREEKYFTKLKVIQKKQEEKKQD